MSTLVTKYAAHALLAEVEFCVFRDGMDYDVEDIIAIYVVLPTEE